MKKIYLTLIAGFIGIAVFAQDKNDRLAFPLNLTIKHFDPVSSGSEIFKLNEASLGFETGLKYYLSPSWNIAGTYGVFALDYPNFYSKAKDLDVSLEYKFYNGNILPEDAKFKPFLTAGYGLFHDQDIPGERHFNVIPVGAGVRYKFSETIDGLLKTRYKITTSDDTFNYLTTSIGLVFKPKSNKDSDGDGVLDKNDSCPNQAGPIGTGGCPDSDGDGVADRMDNCPQIAGLPAFMGCPDSDGDGIMDLEDACPNAAGNLENKGCPDSDNDGVLDKDDVCPSIAGLTELNGCPDSDGDGIADKDDSCPNEAGLAENNGCKEKDTDGDGVIDKNDDCPQTPGVASNNGCPEIEEEVRQVLLEALEGVQFRSGSDDLIGESAAKLDKVVEVMKSHDDFRLRISGYTDNTGNADANLALSQKRAHAAEQYIIDHGIAANRIEAEGYGIANPVADNNTRAGRAKNRRVEFEVVFN